MKLESCVLQALKQWRTRLSSEVLIEILLPHASERRAGSLHCSILVHIYTLHQSTIMIRSDGVESRGGLATLNHSKAMHFNRRMSCNIFD